MGMAITHTNTHTHARTHAHTHTKRVDVSFNTIIYRKDPSMTGKNEAPRGSN